MKKFNLLRASSLILSSYFIIGFSSCSNSLRNSNNNHYVEININDLILEKLKIEDYLKNSAELKEIFNKFEKDYETDTLYIFNIPRTYQEYQFYVYDGKDYINIGYILKNGNELTLEYIINDNKYVKNLKYFFEFNYKKVLKKYSSEITYMNLENNYSYREYSNLDKSIIYNHGNSVLEIILKQNNKIKFRYDLVNNIELDISEEEYNILLNNLIKLYSENKLELYLINNKNLLLEILSRGKKAFVYYEYDAIYDAINNIAQEELVRKK